MSTKLIKRAILSRRQNQYGNIPIWEQRDNDKKLVHIKGDRLTLTCKAHGIDCRRCFVKMRRSRGFANPEYDGIYIAAQDKERLELALAAKSVSQEKREQYVEKMDERLRTKWEAELTRRYPNMPQEEISEVAGYATSRGSGRVGRSATIEDPCRAAVIAHIRHTHTNYEEILESGTDRETARSMVGEDIARIYRQWEGKEQEMSTSESSRTEERGEVRQ